MRFLPVLLSCVLVASAVTRASALQRVESDQDVLIKLERGWNEAFYRKDVAFIERLLAEEFTATYDDGRIGDIALPARRVARHRAAVERVKPGFVVTGFHTRPFGRVGRAADEDEFAVVVEQQLGGIRHEDLLVPAIAQARRQLLRRRQLLVELAEHRVDPPLGALPVQ